LKKMSYENDLNAVQASASIPIFTKGVKDNSVHLFDGGIRDHILDPFYSPIYKNITQSVSIYSRPYDYYVPINKSPKNWFQMISRTTEIMTIEISKTDERLERDFFESINVVPIQVFLPKILENVYDYDHKRLKELYDAGYKLGLETSSKIVK